MKLRTRFALVLTLMSAVLIVNVGASVWGLLFLRRELGWPLQSMQSVMSALHEIKRAGEDQAAMLGSGRGPDPSRPPHPEVFAQLESVIADQLSVLEQNPSTQARSGVSSVSNLRERSIEIRLLTRQWLDGGTPADAERLIDLINQRHEIIERIEGRMLGDAGLAVGHGNALRTVVMLIIAVSVIGAAAIALLVSMLVRRWVLLPVETLRTGAERLGRGDFDHRIDIATTDELGRLGAEFNQMAGLIKDMQDERVERERLAAIGEMARSIVHNLRTPLAGIRNLAEITRSELDPVSELIEVQERIMSSVDRFDGWLTEMLRVSTPFRLETRPFCPATLLRSVIDAHADAAAGKGVSIRATLQGLPPTATADPAHLGHALTALLSNAITYAPPTTEVLIETSSQDGYWSVRVSDGGPGVPIDLQNAIFRPYFTTRAGGTGIGLALVKRIAELHGGTVTVHSPPEPPTGTGTAFVLRMPLGAGDG